MSLNAELLHGVFADKITAFDIGVHQAVQADFVDVINLVIKPNAGGVHHNIEATELFQGLEIFKIDSYI